jgi:hypothetical protein
LASLVLRDHKVAGSNMAAVRDKAEAVCRRIWEFGPGQDAFPEGVTYSA